MSNYKVQATAELAATIKAAGFRVFLAKSGTHGCYTDTEGSRVVSFQYDLGGFRFSGNYKAVNSADGRTTGSGWCMGDAYEVSTEGLRNMFESNPPSWATHGKPVRLVTLAQHLATYGESSGYTELA